MTFVYPVIFWLCGLFSIAGAVFDWDFFFSNSKARVFVRLLGRTGARIFYGILGIAIIIMGIMVVTAPY
ncbi:MAG: Imm17 family immunity protein [Oscillospiraceae bacterium]